MHVDMMMNFSKKSGKPIKELERVWNQAKMKVSTQYSLYDEDGERYYILVMSVFKTMLGIKRESMKERKLKIIGERVDCG